jgi:hypothetical protein
VRFAWLADAGRPRAEGPWAAASGNITAAVKESATASVNA